MQEQKPETDFRPLRTSEWLAKRLGISLSTLERYRSKKVISLPPYIMVGNVIRYDEKVVDEWLYIGKRPEPTLPELENQDEEEKI